MGTFSVLVDWEANGNFTDTHDDITSYVIGDITCKRGKDQVRAISPPVAGELIVAVKNTTQLFSPEYESSAIHAYLKPGKKIQVKFGGGALWTGLIRNIQPDVINQTVTITAFGMLSRLANKKVSISLLENVTTSAVITAILNALDWPVADRVIATGNTTLAHFFAHEVDAMTLIVALWWTEGPGCSIYEDENGKFVFENRNYRTTESRCTSSQFTFTDVSHITQASYSPDNDDIFNQCTIDIEVRTYQVGQIIWELNEQITFSNNETKTWIAKTNDPFANPLAPSPAPSNASQSFTPSATLTSGAFKFRWRGQTTASVAYNASLSTVQAAWDAILGSNQVVVTGSLATSLLLTFIGSYGGQEITDLVEIVDSTLNGVSVGATLEVLPLQDGNGIFTEKQIFAPSGSFNAGSVQVDTPAGTSASIAHSASAATIQTTLRSIPGLTNTLCNGGPWTAGASVVVNFADVTSDWPLVDIVPTGLTQLAAGATLNVEIASSGGERDYTVSAGTITATSITQLSATTAEISMTAGASGATINRSRARADVFSVVRTEQVKNDNDLSASLDAYGPRPLSHSILAGISQATAQTLANAHAAAYADPRPNLPFAVPGKNSTLETQNRTRKISDRITAQESHTGINDDHFIEHMDYTLITSTDVSGQAWLDAVYGCEQVA